VRSRPGPGPILRVARQLERERAAAKPAVDELRRSIQDRWDGDVPAAWRTIGFVQELTAAASDLTEREPMTSAALAQFAIVVITGIPDDAYPPPVRLEADATAWKELASAHRYVSKYDAAIRALDAADRCLDQAPALGYDRAVLRFARALVFSEMRRFAEASAFLSESLRMFEDFHDRRRVGQCLLLQGVLEQRRGLLVEACMSYDEAIAIIRDTDDLFSLACVYNNLAQARIDLGHTDAAMTALHAAFAIFSDLAIPAEIARVRWVMGRVLLGSGQFRQAHDVLAEARMTFIALRMPEDAGLMGLELAEACVALGQDDRARMIIEEVAGEFVRAGLNDRALTALAYLREVLPSGRGREAVRHVRTYIEKLRHEPLRVFAPLPVD
jgi:tetratricopeptide (TPR) repeat protein